MLDVQSRGKGLRWLRLPKLIEHRVYGFRASVGFNGLRA